MRALKTSHSQATVVWDYADMLPHPQALHTGTSELAVLLTQAYEMDGIQRRAVQIYHPSKATVSVDVDRSWVLGQSEGAEV